MSSLFVPIQKADLEWKGDLPFSTQFNDIYHSSESGIEQSRYVFIDGNDLISRWQSLSDQKQVYFNIAETGFGTGLNFLLTWKLWEEHAPENAVLHFFSCEKHPLSTEHLGRCLQVWSELGVYSNQLIAQYPVLTPGFHHLSFADGRVKLTLMLGDAQECYEQLLECGDYGLEREIRRGYIDAWYLDGFRPSKNQCIWHENLFTIIALLSKNNTTVATYTASAPVKAALVKTGFTVLKKKGFGPKRHMVTARLVMASVNDFKTKDTPWHVNKPLVVNDKSVMIVGAGLAGCFLANSLAKRDWQVTLVDKNKAVALGGSGNEQAVLFPKLSAYKSPFTQFMLNAFLYANRVYTHILEKHSIGELTGSLLIDHNEKEKNNHKRLVDWLSSYPELGELVNSNRATELAGIEVSNSGLFIPMSGWMNAPELCRLLIEGNDNIQVHYDEAVSGIDYKNNRWHINDKSAPILIIANGQDANQFDQTRSLPIKSISGQMTMIGETESSQSLKIPLCGEGHVLPSYNKCHHMGATYHLDTKSAQVSEQDDMLNLIKLKQLSPHTSWSERVLNHWAGVRAASPDYLPMVGPVAIENEFLNLYAGLHSNSKRWIPKSGPYYNGLYVCAAFGSRGLTSIPLATEWLASKINNEVSILPRKLIQAISPSRFLRKKIIHNPG